MDKEDLGDPQTRSRKIGSASGSGSSRLRGHFGPDKKSGLAAIASTFHILIAGFEAYIG